MKFIKIIRDATATVIALIWFGYAVINAINQMPYLELGSAQGWTNETVLSNIVAKANGRVLGQDSFLDLQGYLNAVLDRTLLANSTITRTDRGGVAYTSFYPYEMNDYREVALKLEKLKEQLSERGISLSFLSSSDSFSHDLTDNSGLPLNNQEHRIDELLYMLRGYDINCYDARLILRAAGMTTEETTYLTDTRQTIGASLEIALALLGELGSEEGQWLDRDNYVTTNYEEEFVGNIGKRVGIPYMQAEDFALIEPAFATDFTISYDERSGREALSGDFTETFLYNKQAIQSSSRYDSDLRSLYLLQPYAYRKIINHNNPDGLKLLVIGDESMLPITAFMAAGVSEIELVWPYSAPLDSGTMQNYIEGREFDHVLIGLSAENMSDSNFGFLAGIEID